MEFDFAQNAAVADVNRIPADFRGLYKQDGDKHVLDTENASVKSAISAITGLNNALKAARAEAKAKPQPVDLTLLKDYGATPDEIAAAIKTKVEGLEGQIKGVNVDKIRQDLTTEWAPKLTAEQNKAKALEGHLYTELVESRAVSAIAKEGGDPELLLPFVQRQVKAGVTTEGKYVVNVVDSAGDIRYSGVTGKPMSVPELVAEMKGQEKFGPLFKSEAPSGGGAKPGAAAKPGGAAAAIARGTAELSPIQKIAAGLSKRQATR